MTDRTTLTDQQTHHAIHIRPATEEDISAMLALFADEVAAGRMLPRDANKMRDGIDNWLTAVKTDGQIIGCVSLVAFNDDLCEVRSLAVHRSTRGMGLGSLLIQSAVALARERGYKRVLSLTRAAGLFERNGFRRDTVTNFPEKVWTDCAPCPFKDACDEIALVYLIEDQHQHNGNGNHGS